ncbi:uncharacterized protein LOC107303637 [Oryza brachyantha]|uniref:Uncharacterized protein n=1 Tax=Oryza brachyantha TaxID=4533 RepID=J3LIQ2_ORYBR|nr:uncharacterized protein LOC107303637 [Oryza brachyantha]
MARQLPRTGSFSGVWWKLGDDADEQRRLADEEAAVKARIQRRHATARAVRRTIAFTSLTLETAAFVYGLWMARRRRRDGINKTSAAAKTTTTKLLLPVPAFAALLFAAFSRFHHFFDAKDQQKLDRLRAERKAKMGLHSNGSHHNMQKLLIHNQESDPGSPAAAKKGHSRLSFHVGDDE